MKKCSILLAAVILLQTLCTAAPVLAAEQPWPTEYNLQGKEMPFRPEDKYVTEQNPPDFSWPSVSYADSYDLKVCRDKDLTDTAYEKSGITDNFYNFDQPFAIGTYYWSVRFRSASGNSVWTPARRFRIDPDASEFPVPPLAKLLEKIPESHPRIFTTKEGLSDFRAPLAQAEGSSYLAKITQEVREAMALPLPSEPKAEDYANSDDLFYKLRLDHLTKTTHPMLKSGLIYLLTGDKEIGRFGVDLLTAMSKWDPNGPTSYTSQDQVHREIAYMGAVAYDWLCDLMTQEEKDTVLSMIKTRTKTMADHLIDAEVSIKERPYESHGWTAFGYILIISLATYHDLPEAEQWMEFVLPTFLNVLPPWSNEDGGWSQGTYYYTASTSQNQLLYDILKNAGIIDIGQKAWMRNELWFPLYTYPAGSVGTFGDSSYSAQGKALIYAYSRMAGRYQSGLPKWALEEIGDISMVETFNDGNLPVLQYLNILDGYQNIEAEMPLTLPSAKRFKDIGWAAMHSDLTDQNRISLFFKSSPFGSFNHSHADQNTFVIQAFGERLAIDSGYYAYGTDWENKYVRQTFAHNGITLNGGKGQTINSFLAKGSLDEFVTHPDFDMVKGDASQAYENLLKKADRYILYVRPDTFIVIDDLESANEKGANYEWWLNGMSGTISVYENGTGARLTKGAAALDAQIQYPEKVNYQYSNIFSGADLAEVARPAAYQNSDTHQRIWFETEKLPKTKMVTTLDVHRSSENPQYIASVSHGDYIELSFENGTKAYVKTTDAETVDTGSIQFRGAAVLVNDASVMLVSGTYLKAGETVLVDADKNLSAAMGRGLVNLSAPDDTTVTLGYAGCDSLLDSKGRTLNEKTGVRSLEIAESTVSLSLDKGDYNLCVNGTKAEPELLSKEISVTINESTASVSCKGSADPAGNTVLHGRAGNPAGMYQIVDLSPGMNLANAEKNEIKYLPANARFAAYNDDNPNIVLKTVDFPLYEAEKIDDHEALKKSCTVFLEAEDFASKEGASAKYDTRAFLSGGAGLTQLDSTNDSAAYEFEIPESGTYRMVLKHVAWNEGTQRQFILGTYTGMFTCPLTDGWGSVPEQWKGMEVKNDFYLEAGKHKLTLRGLNYNWNVDWIGFVKK
ncbi:DUF4962 domain-containing protein [Acetivibrio sp. MSJd-27]|uniref:DUF4962 domain-containing protein n=1 Tax=Acetivibrio sp. MSJd-27 TaxID=2841523 RepID=UPI001C108BE1|nr:DUF4962 domain-containing protein [Acetivibrio sp. MSJd-27]MBU5449833.1 DUF4962 domain-containing protein [Acetivibrio sp. MSJd-27]